MSQSSNSKETSVCLFFWKPVQRLSFEFFRGNVWMVQHKLNSIQLHFISKLLETNLKLSAWLNATRFQRGNQFSFFFVFYFVIWVNWLIWIWSLGSLTRLLSARHTCSDRSKACLHGPLDNTGVKPLQSHQNITASVNSAVQVLHQYPLYRFNHFTILDVKSSSSDSSCSDHCISIFHPLKKLLMA